MWKTVIFDLDGTLRSPQQGVISSVQYALGMLGRQENDPAKLQKFLSMPLRTAFTEVEGLTEEEAQKAQEAYREFYSGQGIFMGTPYPMVPELMMALKRAGMGVAVIAQTETSKAIRIMQNLGIARFCDRIVGLEQGESPVEKNMLLERALTALGKRYARGEVVYVGDSFYDMEAAKISDVSACGVTYGSGSVEELQESGADLTVGDVNSLARALLSGGPVRGTYGSGQMTLGQKLSQILVPILLWYGISMIISSIGGAVYGVIKVNEYIASGKDTQNAVYDILNQLRTSDFMMVNMILSAISSLVSIPVMYAVYKKDIFRSTGKRTTLRAEKKPGAVNALLCVVMGLAVSVILNVLISMTGISQWMYEMNPGRYDMLNSLPVWAEFFAVCIFAPISEELLFRAVIFRRMRKFTSYMTAAVVSAAIFGIVHFDVVTGICAFLIGVLMAMIYEYTGSIFTSMFFHFGFNFYSVGLSLIGIDKMAEQTQGTILLILLAVSLIAAPVTMYIFMKKNKAKA